VVPSDRSYADFDVSVERSEGGGFRARVLDSPAGQATGEFTMPFSDMEIENFLLRVGRPTRGTRRLESPEMEAVRAFGGRLYDALFRGDLELSLRRSLDEAERTDRGLRIRLRLNEVPELANLPWEYLFNGRADRFLVLSAWTPIVRYVDLPSSIEPLTVDGPIRILALISSPRDYPALDVDQEWDRCREALAPLIAEGSVAIDLVENATLLELQRTLRRNEYHVFHYVGHGGFDAAADDGVLVLEDGADRSRVVSGRDLGTILHDHRSLRLAVLNACEGARSSVDDPFSGVAQSLVRQGIPSVVAMQFEITDDAAIAFAHEFYAAVSDGYPIDAAVSEARRAIFGLGNDIEWGTPVLYMRTADGHLFDVTRSRPPADAAVEDAPIAGGDAPVAETPVGGPVAPAETPERDAVAGAAGDEGTSRAAGPDQAGDSASTGTGAAPEAIVTDASSEAVPVDTAPVDTAPVDTGGPGLRLTPAMIGGAVAGVVLLVIVLVAVLGGGDTGGGDTTTTTGDTTTTTGGDTTTTSAVRTVAPDGQAFAAFAPGGRTIDGSDDDWPNGVVHETPHVIFTHPRIGNGVARAGTDATAEVLLAWDETSLYVLARVEDDVHSQPNEGNQVWRGDAVDLNLAVLGPDATASAAPGSDDFQVTLSPGDPGAGTSTDSVLFVGNGEQFFDNRTGVARVAATIGGGGYVLEAAIPWSELGVSGPAAGDRFGVIVAVFDNDGERDGDRSLQTVILANTPGAGFQQPDTWGTLVLGE
jgi:hypothetical protein